MVVVDGQGIPLGIHVTSATPAEVNLVAATLNTIRVPRVGRGRPRQNPARLIGDRGYDSNGLRTRLAARGIIPIMPYRWWSKQRIFEDGSFAPLSSSVDHRTDVCVVWQFSALTHSLRTTHVDVPFILVFRRSAYHAEEVLKPLLVSIAAASTRLKRSCALSVSVDPNFGIP